MAGRTFGCLSYITNKRQDMRQSAPPACVPAQHPEAKSDLGALGKLPFRARSTTWRSWLVRITTSCGRSYNEIQFARQKLMGRSNFLRYEYVRVCSRMCMGVFFVFSFRFFCRAAALRLCKHSLLRAACVWYAARDGHAAKNTGALMLFVPRLLSRGHATQKDGRVDVFYSAVAQQQTC